MFKKQKELSAEGSRTLSSKNIGRNWYQDRYTFITIQRNILALLSFVMAVTILGGLAYMYILSQSKSIEPVVIEIEEKTGIPAVVDQMTKAEYTANQVMQKYFLFKYLKAREGYDIATYRYNYYTVVRLLSSSNIFSSFYSQVSTRNENSPVNKYGREVILVPQIKSMQALTSEKDTMQIRFLIKHIRGSFLQKEEHRIAIIKFGFANMALNQQEVLENPLGFQVYEYKVDEDFVGK
jgi:type IV secretion system protein VirB8